MERQTISQLVKGALEELEKQRYARISIKNNKQDIARFVRYAAKKGEAFLSDSLARSYFLDTYGWDMNYSAAPSAQITHQLRAIRILMCYGASGCIPGKLSRAKEPPPNFKNHYDLYITECISRVLSDATVAGRSYDVCSLLLHARSKDFAGVAEIDQESLDEYLHYQNVLITTKPGCGLKANTNGCMLFRLLLILITNGTKSAGQRLPMKSVSFLNMKEQWCTISGTPITNIAVFTVSVMFLTSGN